MPNLHTEIIEVFRKAERNIKKIERLGEGLAFPAVNQLRYVAFHLLRAWDTSEKEEINQDEMREALYHAHRSLHDSAEIGISYLLEYIRQFQKDYKTVAITDVVTNYLEICLRSNDAKKYLTTRTNNSVKEHANGESDEIKDINKTAERFDKYFELLEEDVNILKVARIELNKKLKIRRNAAIGFLITTAVGVIAILITLLA